MSKMKNQKFFDIALAVGGSHYPGVGGELLEKFGEMVAQTCAEVAEEVSPGEPTYGWMVAQKIKEHFGVK